MKLLAGLLAAVAVYGAVTSQVAVMVLAIVLAIGVVAIEAMGTAQKRRAEVVPDELSNESRTMLRPLRRSRDELRALVVKHGGSGAIKVIGNDAIEEADRIVDHASRLLVLRQQAKKASFGKSLSEEEAADLELRLASATEPAERMALEGALSARKAEGEHYQPLEETLRAIDSSLVQAEAALSEMKARLNLAIADEAKYVHGDEGALTETVTRLRSLGTSMDEAEEMLRGHLGS